MRVCIGICIPPTAMQLGDNDHTHACAHLHSHSESTLQNINLTHTAAILSSMAQDDTIVGESNDCVCMCVCFCNYCNSIFYILFSIILESMAAAHARFLF